MPTLAGTPEPCSIMDVNNNRYTINLRDVSNSRYASNSRNHCHSWNSRSANGSKNIGNSMVTSKQEQRQQELTSRTSYSNCKRRNV